MKKAKAIAKELRNKLKEYNDFTGLYLYGSQVTDKATELSDIDIVAIFDGAEDNYEDAVLKAWDLEIQHGVVIDFHPFSTEQIQSDPFYFNEIKKGIYYAR